MFIDCLSCNSGTDVNCKNNPENVRTYCQSETCFGRNNPETNIYTRGCLKETEVQGCVEDLNCFTCKDSEHCNEKQDPVLECFQCEGDSCVNIDFATQTRQQCKDGGKCITQLNSNGQVVRKCTASENEKCTDNTTCSICESQLCNGGLFPADRLKCLQCDSATAGDECSVSNDKFLKACNLYKKDDQCFKFADDKDLIHRGCVSDNNVGCTDDNCVKCSGDKCNNEGLEVANTLKCVKCDSSKDEECEAGKLTVEPVLCNGNHNLNKPETCFVQNVTSGDNKITTKRGCFQELSTDEQTACIDSETCHTCGIEGCNKVDNFSESKGFKCYICSSENNKDCEKEIGSGVNAETCPQTPNSFNEGPGCFVQRVDKDVVVRDCKTSASSHKISFDSCSVDTEEKGKTCIVCEGDSCNKMAAPGTATSVKIYGSLIALSAVFVVKYL